MPIFGLTTQRAALPPVIGKLRKGGEGKAAKTKDGRDYKTYGEDLNHFRFTPRNEQDAQLIQDFSSAYGNEPQRVEVYLPSDEVDTVFEAFQEEYTAAQLLHRCDGQYTYERDRATGEYYQTTTPCPWVGKERTAKNPGCKQIGRLSVILPELVAAGHYGIVTVETHSINDIANIHRALTDFRQRFGRLTGVPFYVYRYPESISTPSGTDGKRARREKWLVGITPATEFVQKQLEAARQHALGNTQHALPAPTIDHETGEIYEGESVPIVTAQEIEQSAEDLWGMDFPPSLEKTIQLFSKGKYSYPEELDNAARAKLNDVLRAKIAKKQEEQPAQPALDPMELAI